MFKFVLVFIFCWYQLPVFSQTYDFNYGFKNVKEGLEFLNDKEKNLLLECIKISGYHIDSLIGVDKIYNTKELLSSNIKAIVRSDYLFLDPVTKKMTDFVVEISETEKRYSPVKFMFFLKRDNLGSKITLQMYY